MRGSKGEEPWLGPSLLLPVTALGVGVPTSEKYAPLLSFSEITLKGCHKGFYKGGYKGFVEGE